MVSRYPAVLQRCQLHFSGMFLVPSSCSQAHSSLASSIPGLLQVKNKPFLYQYFQQTFFSVQSFFPFKPDHFYGCSHHWVELNLVETVCLYICLLLLLLVDQSIPTHKTEQGAVIGHRAQSRQTTGLFIQNQTFLFPFTPCSFFLHKPWPIIFFAFVSTQEK